MTSASSNGRAPCLIRSPALVLPRVPSRGSLVLRRGFDKYCIRVVQRSNHPRFPFEALTEACGRDFDGHLRLASANTDRSSAHVSAI
jgi:hypothetical protein